MIPQPNGGTPATTYTHSEFHQPLNCPTSTKPSQSSRCEEDEDCTFSARTIKSIYAESFRELLRSAPQLPLFDLYSPYDDNLSEGFNLTFKLTPRNKRRNPNFTTDSNTRKRKYASDQNIICNSDGIRHPVPITPTSKNSEEE
mmetsp:Transcript_40418/g.48464  ORF Transcript_40418/g.48464 Transcript_40418/m.48464 type:complete len:143 (+) Transcript_40418:74-502(+)